MLSESTVQENTGIDHATVYASLGVAAAVYAAYLNTQVGRDFSERYTWASVTVGTALVLAAARLLMPQQLWQRLVLAFTIAGLPMILRSGYNRSLRSERSDSHALR